MRFFTSILVMLSFNQAVMAAETTVAADPAVSFYLDCAYSYYGSPFAQIKLTYLEAGHFADFAEITHYGKMTTETLTEEAPEVGESHRFTISKESEENWLTVVIYPDQATKLINPHIPIAKEMMGTCQLIAPVESTKSNSTSAPL